MITLTKNDALSISIIDSLVELFSHEYWTKNRSILDVQYIISHSNSYIILVEDNSVIGFGRVVSDGKFVATIYDVIVKKEFRLKGFGKLIVKYLLETNKNIQTIDLLSKDYNLEFYEKLGFIKDESLHLMRMIQN